MRGDFVCIIVAREINVTDAAQTIQTTKVVVGEGERSKGHLKALQDVIVF